MMWMVKKMNKNGTWFHLGIESGENNLRDNAVTQPPGVVARGPVVPDRRPVEPRPKQPRQDVGVAVKEPEFSLSPSSFWEDQDAAVSVAIDLPGWNSSQRREMFRDMEAFVVRQIKRQNVEVSEKRMTPEEKEQFKGAKMKEGTNYISSKVFSILPSHLLPDRSQAMQMRWVLTWKVTNEGQKAKARCVILGFKIRNMRRDRQPVPQCHGRRDSCFSSIAPTPASRCGRPTSPEPSSKEDPLRGTCSASP